MLELKSSRYSSLLCEKATRCSMDSGLLIAFSNSLIILASSRLGCWYWRSINWRYSLAFSWQDDKERNTCTDHLVLRPSLTNPQLFLIFYKTAEQGQSLFEAPSCISIISHKDQVVNGASPFWFEMFMPWGTQLHIVKLIQMKTLGSVMGISGPSVACDSSHMLCWLPLPARHAVNHC